MIERNKKTVVGLLLSILILLSPAFVGVNFAQATRIYVDPPNQTVEVGTQFTVDINVSAVSNLYSFEFWLGFDPNRLDALDVVPGSFLALPIQIIAKNIDNTAGFVNFYVTSTAPTPSSGDGILAIITFECTGSGVSPLHLYSTSLFDFLGNSMLHGTVDGSVMQTPPWFVKPAFPDYTPSGMPDFDQKQDGWTNPMAGWTWCGPVAVANSLWWFDSEYESRLNPSPVPPPTYSDKFRLVQPYGAWDDHDPRNVGPLVNALAYLMDTDGRRTNLTHSGTFFNDTLTGISQYIAQQGVNPRGDCDGDGDVDFDDLIIWQKANGTVPGDPNWNMAADVIPDNSINSFDMSTILANFGKIGTFCEHTVEFPDFSWIADQVYECEDVVLLIELWQDTGGGNWSRYMYDPGGQGGHYVTLAGANSTNSQLLLSDPWIDAFEANKTSGESPAAHLYPHSANVHNDTLFVSHDAYVTAPWIIPQPAPYPAPIWELLNYCQVLGFDPTWHAFIRATVVTSPIKVAVLRTVNSKEPCYPMSTVGQGFTANVSASIANNDTIPQTFTVTAYANWTVIGSRTGVNLAPGAKIDLTVTTWNTSGWAYGDYFLTVGTSASVQAFTSGNALRVTIPGDINGDGTVDILDAILLSNAFKSRPGDPSWNPNADINGDGVVDILDAILLSMHYNQHYP